MNNSSISVLPNVRYRAENGTVTNLLKQIMVNGAIMLITMPLLRMLLLASNLKRQASIAGHSKWNLWWLRWQERFLSDYLGIPLAVSFHQCSMIIYSCTTDGINTRTKIRQGNITFGSYAVLCAKLDSLQNKMYA